MLSFSSYGRVLLLNMKNKHSNPKNRKFKKIALDENWEKINPNAAGIDIGARQHFVCVPSNRDKEPVRGFGTKTPDPRQIKNVTGRKSDVMDCQWIQKLHTFGLLGGSFRPADPYCVARTYMRLRDDLTAGATTQIQLMQKALHQMNVQLSHVLTLPGPAA
jgi:transposase